MPSNDTRFCLSEDVVFQSLGDGHETVLVSLSTGFLYSCNDTTRAFLEAVDGNKTLADIGRELVAVFTVSEERLLKDLRMLADRMLAEGLIWVANEKSA
ncbi:MAG: PqqD family protein [Syntrophobacteraceae bacterium]